MDVTLDDLPDVGRGTVPPFDPVVSTSDDQWVERTRARIGRLSWLGNGKMTILRVARHPD
jgi:hypothetical protein